MLDLIVIDDDKFMHKVLDGILTNKNISYKFFDDPVLAISEVEKEKPSCVVVDFMMPNLKGDELIVKASQKLLFKTSNFIMITGETLDEMQKMKMMTLGFQYIFSKKELRSDAFVECVLELIADKKQSQTAS